MKIAILTGDSSLHAAVSGISTDSSTEVSCYQDQVVLLREILKNPPQALVVDLDPSGPPSNALFDIRQLGALKDIPLLAITSQAGLSNSESHLLYLADDFLQRPFSINEMKLRLKAVAARLNVVVPGMKRLVEAPYQLDQQSSEVLCESNIVRLTEREFSLAWLLFSNVGTCLTRARIAQVVWVNRGEYVDRTLEQHVHVLRKKLALDGSYGLILKAVYGRGYRLERLSTPKEKTSTKYVKENTVEFLIHG